MTETPLQNCKVAIKDAPNRYSFNARGRPKREKIILFSEPLQSTVSQVLSRKKNDTISIVKKIDLEVILQKTLVESAYNNLHMNEENKETEHSKNYKLYSCDYTGCKYSCKLSSNLIKHKRVHTDEKPYLCDRCCFRSNFMNSLKVHRRIHTTERPYQCQHCDYKCNSSSNLKKHSLHRHAET